MSYETSKDNYFKISGLGWKAYNAIEEPASKRCSEKNRTVGFLYLNDCLTLWDKYLKKRDENKIQKRRKWWGKSKYSWAEAWPKEILTLWHIEPAGDEFRPRKYDEPLKEFVKEREILKTQMDNSFDEFSQIYEKELEKARVARKEICGAAREAHRREWGHKFPACLKDGADKTNHGPSYGAGRLESY